MTLLSWFISILIREARNIFRAYSDGYGHRALTGLHCSVLMSQSRAHSLPRTLPKPLTELCAHLEERGLRSFSHGDGLLDELRPQPRTEAAGPRTQSILCSGPPAQVLAALPKAVVTSEFGTRLTQATEGGPVDILCMGDGPMEEALLDFALGPYALAFRPADLRFCDPRNQLDALGQGRLELASRHPAPFAHAPRRYWIAARLAAEYDLTPTDDVIESARGSLEEITRRLPHGAPARREISRILASQDPTAGLAFLHDTGVTTQIAPGALPIQAARIARLPTLPSLRWAAWLRGSATARGLVRLRVPHRLARRVEHLQGLHPLDRSIESSRDVSIRRILSRTSEEERDALFAWRRLEVAEIENEVDAAAIEQRLQKVEARIEAMRANDTRAGQVRTLALDGSAVMELLGAGPGRHVGNALAHLARFVEAEPDSNETGLLEAELRRWAEANTNLLE